MNAAACEILRHRPVERHGLGIPAVWCDCCGFDFPSSGAVPGVETLSPQGLGHPQSAGAPVTTSHDSPLSVTPDPFPRRAPRGAERDAAATPAGA